MSMSKIQVMDTQLSNMIAAGEVVERPASAVKELVENSVDAGATKIEIHLQESGISQIKVIDNGAGMSQQDAKLAFLRHATSKVKSAQDIMRIQTLGFRGEALPSIAAVSDVQLKTSDGEHEGYAIHMKGGEVKAKQPFAMRKGTEIVVNHLFFNTPARLKHLKSLNTELSHITDYMTKTALAHPNIAFTLTNNHRDVFKTPGQTNTQTVVSRLYGFDIAKMMHPFTGGNDDFKISGLMSAPEVTRASRHYITLIVNKRPIKHYDLVRTVVDAYHTYLPKDRFPIAVIHIEIDPLLVDVNVHPAKIEVRFSKEEALKSFILTQIQNTLKTITHIPTPTLVKPVPKKDQPLYQQPSLLMNQPHQPLGNEGTYRGNDETSSKKMEIRESAGPGYHVEAEFDKGKGAAEQVPIKYPHPIKNEQRQSRVEAAEKEKRVRIPNRGNPHLELYYIGQLHGTYLLAQNEEGLFLIDQHAAMERVEYEKNYPLLGAAHADAMTLLVPLTLSYPVSELVRVKSHLPKLIEFGFEIEVFGVNDLIVRTTPSWAVKDAKPIVETVIQTLLNGKEVSIAKLREAVAIMMSCKKSIKANQYINEAEVRGLLVDLCQCEQPYTCPHGRPIIVKITKYEIEKLFKRV
ncbi:MAG: DNA mismatch repair endonuclease MutL [Defluviitaleaceae bacterium]|nr:DNA mismatch repair endonuclease MutL [Defluviitaleaceae bacterium]